MLVQVLQVLGFDDFGFWRSSLPEAANHWRQSGSERFAASLNISAVKRKSPVVDIHDLYRRIRHHEITESFMTVVRKMLGEDKRLSGVSEIDSAMFQKLFYQYLQATHDAEHWEKKYKAFVMDVSLKSK